MVQAGVSHARIPSVKTYHQNCTFSKLRMDLKVEIPVWGLGVGDDGNKQNLLFSE